MSEKIAKPQMMGPWLTTALVVGSMIGSGIFLLPVALAPFGLNAVIAWLVSITGALSIAFALARLSRIGGDGGIQAYIEQAFGPLTGFTITWAFWVSSWVATAAVAIAFGSAVSRISPMFGADTVIVLAIGTIAFLTAVNALGVRASGALNMMTVAIKLLPLVGAVVLLVVTAGSGQDFQPLVAAPLSIGAVASATALTLFAMLGFENATTPVGKVRDPSRTLPRAILGGTALVGLIYLASSSAVLLLLPAASIVNSPAPFADVFAATGGETLVLLAASAIAISAFGSNNCGVLVNGELAYAMALRRQLPPAMARTWGGTPVVAQIVSSGLAVLLVMANSSRSAADLFTFTILLTTSATLFVYLAGTAAAWTHCNTWGARIVLVLAAIFIAFAFWGAGFEANAWCLLLLACGVAIYYVMRAINSRGSTPATEAAPAAPPGSAA